MGFSASGIMIANYDACWNNLATSSSMIAPSYSHQDYEYLEKAYTKEKPKEKHFCKYCHTNSEKTNSYGSCIACGAPFGEDENKTYLINKVWNVSRQESNNGWIR